MATLESYQVLLTATCADTTYPGDPTFRGGGRNWSDNSRKHAETDLCAHSYSTHHRSSRALAGGGTSVGGGVHALPFQ